MSGVKFRKIKVLSGIIGMQIETQIMKLFGLFQAYLGSFYQSTCLRATTRSNGGGCGRGNGGGCGRQCKQSVVFTRTPAAPPGGSLTLVDVEPAAGGAIHHGKGRLDSQVARMVR